MARDLTDMAVEAATEDLRGALLEAEAALTVAAAEADNRAWEISDQIEDALGTVRIVLHGSVAPLTREG